MTDPDPSVRHLADLLGGAGRVLVLSGAGLSTESGIADFRGPNGLWTRNPAAMRMFDIDVYIAERDVRVAAWRQRFDSEIRTAQPNEGHAFLAALGQRMPVTIATQNIDGLHQRAGSGSVLELHGTFWWSVCLTCGTRADIEDVFARVADGEEDPECLQCGGILRTATVAFGQPLDPTTWGMAVAAAQSCDVALAVGTSLAVQPAASLCGLAVQSGAQLAILNGEPTPYDDIATTVVRRPIGATLTQVGGLLALPGM